MTLRPLFISPTAQRVVENDKDLQPVLTQVNDLRALQQVFAECAGPKLAAIARVCELTSDGRLTLAVDSNAAATLVRQNQSSLMQNLVGKGVQVTKLRPQVQVTAVMPPPQRPPKPEIPKQFLAKIAEDMTDSPLKIVIQSISRTNSPGKR